MKTTNNWIEGTGGGGVVMGRGISRWFLQTALREEACLEHVSQVARIQTGAGR